MVLGVYMWAKKGSRESSFKVLDNRGSHDWKLQSSCGKITDRCHVGFRCRLSFSVVLSLKCWHPQCTPVTLQLVLLHRHKPHQKLARLHWWVGRRDNIQRGTFSSQKPKKSLKLWFMLPHVVFPAGALRSISRDAMEISIKIPDYRSTQPTSWNTAELRSVAALFQYLPLHCSVGVKWLFFTWLVSSVTQTFAESL